MRPIPQLGPPCFLAGLIVILSLAPLPRAFAEPFDEPRDAGPAAPTMVPGVFSQGAARVSPGYGISGEFGTWTVTYKVGEGGIGKGGGVRVQLPDSWHAGPRNSANRLQAGDPAASHYISARASRRTARVQAIVESETEQELVKHAKDSLDGRSERYVFVVRAWVTRGQLRPGDTISVVYGDRSGGGPGMLAAAISTDPEPILLAVDTAGNGGFQLLEMQPRIQAIAGDPVEMLFHAPSQAAAGKPIRMSVSLLDKQYNPVMQPARLRLSIVTGQASFPETLRMPPRQGYVELEVTPKTTGPLRLKAETGELSAISNPADVTAAPPERKIYWGDLHSHGRHSWDGVGDDSFHYARHITGLDFYALTDHSILPTGGKTRGLSKATWDEYTALTDQHHDPPRFVTIHAYEASFRQPYGHHNVYFRDRPGPLVYPQRTTLEELWKMLEAGNALTIPHHTGKFPGGIDLGHHDPVFRRNFEIYSGHGLSEVYDPGHPLSFEHSAFTSPSRSLPAPTFAQDAWKRGLALSTIAASDDHRGQPGQPHYGLAAVRAAALERNEIFQALHDRHTYGTTGARIVLDFSVDGTPMGQTAQVSAPPLLKVRALGTGLIERIELLKWRSPMEKFAVLHAWHPNALDFEGEYRDADHAPGTIYYVRLRQKETIRDHLVKAWSSPIWTETP